MDAPIVDLAAIPAPAPVAKESLLAKFGRFYKERRKFAITTLGFLSALVSYGIVPHGTAYEWTLGVIGFLTSYTMHEVANQPVAPKA